MLKRFKYRLKNFFRIQEISDNLNNINLKLVKFEQDIKKLKKISEKSLRYEETYEYVISSMSEALSNINDNSICIDCGAHFGIVSEVFLKFGAKVHTLEPNINLSNYIKFRLSEYIRNQRLFVYNNAVWDRKEQVKLYMRPDYNHNSNFLDIMSESSSILMEKTTVDKVMFTDKENFLLSQSIDLSEFIQELDCIVDILKIDIEGAEFDVLIKLIETGIYKKIKYIFVETHNDKISELNKKADYVKDLIIKNDIKNIDLDWH